MHPCWDPLSLFWEEPCSQYWLFSINSSLPKVASQFHVGISLIDSVAELFSWVM